MRFAIRTKADLLHMVDKVVPTLDGKPYTLVIKPFHVPRSLDQNKKMHAMIGELADFCGYSRNRMKEIVKNEFGPKEVVEVGQRVVDITKGTSDYDVHEMSEMIERLYQLGAELGHVFQVE